MTAILRRTTHQVHIGNRLSIGSQSPIVVQAMTNTDTADVDATVRQIIRLAEAGAELVRVTVNNEAAAASIGRIRDCLEQQRVGVPLVGDFHFNGHRLLAHHPACAQALDKYRINPGNVGRGSQHDAHFAFLIEQACRYDKPVRIGVNWGSLDAEVLTRLMTENARRSEPLSAEAVLCEALVSSALESATRAMVLGLPANRIVLSAKVSQVQDLIAVYGELARRCDYPLHLGLTEAGMGLKGVVASTSALAVLLQQGIGDTIRVSLTPEPGGAREREVQVAQHILQSLGLRRFMPSVTACPGCGRTTSTVFQELASHIEQHLTARRVTWKARYPGADTLHVAVMGCVVNGPGESRLADIGISLPGTGEQPSAPVYMDGQHALTLHGPQIAEDFTQLLDDYVAARYGADLEARQRLAGRLRPSPVHVNVDK